jgi:threonine dehydratase
MQPSVTAADIENAEERIRPYIHRTPVLTSASVNRMAGAELYFKCENFQKVGAFKARGATNTIFTIPETELVHGVATHSSGNHAQALSWAASLREVPAYIVMPSNSSKVKVEAVRSYGGEITFCEPTLIAREETLAEVMKKTRALEIHPYNDVRIIAGQATAALELLQDTPDLDLVLAPVGGGGLLSGTSLAAFHFFPETDVIGVEPVNANDAFLSFTQKKFIPSVNPDTIADGLRTSLGTVTFPIIVNHVKSIVTVSEDSIIRAMRILWERMKILVEPSSAIAFAAFLENQIPSYYQRIGIIISGGNVDLDNLPWMKNI